MEQLSTEQELSSELLPCPFCGGQPVLLLIGFKGVRIKCAPCYIVIEQKVIRQTQTWLVHHMRNKWNTRILLPSRTIPNPSI